MPTLVLTVFTMKPNYRFKDIKWSKDLPSETFSFYACEIKLSSERQTYKSWIYWPHPSTKPEFKQKENILEILAPSLDRFPMAQKSCCQQKRSRSYFKNQTKKTEIYSIWCV